MKVFISWSGEKSKAAATALREWLPCVFQAVKPWMSETDIDAGARWSAKISAALEGTNIGIVCVTKQNLTAPWLLFEAGALAKTVEESKVIPYLLDLEPADIPQGPLSQFQAKRANKKETFELLSDLNGLLEKNGLAKGQLEKTFDKWWADLESVLRKLPEEGDDAAKIQRGQEEKVDEILGIVRDLQRGRGGSPAKVLDLQSALFDAIDNYSEDEGMTSTVGAPSFPKAMNPENYKSLEEVLAKKRRDKLKK